MTAAARVAQSFLRKTNTIATISAILIRSESSTSRTLARIVSVRSLITARSTARGSHVCRVGMRARTRFTVSMTFALASVNTKTSTAGLSLYQPEVRTFSTLSTTEAIESRRMGVPPRVAIMTDLYSSALRI